MQKAWPRLGHMATCFAESVLEEEMSANLQPLHPDFFRESTAPDLLCFVGPGGVHMRNVSFVVCNRVLLLGGCGPSYCSSLGRV